MYLNMKVYNGLWIFTTVYEGLQWFMKVYNDLWRFSTVHEGSKRVLGHQIDYVQIVCEY